MRIRYETRIKYGQKLDYVIDEDMEIKQAINSMTGMETITPRTAAALKTLGHELVEVVHAGSKVVEVE